MNILKDTADHALPVASWGKTFRYAVDGYKRHTRDISIVLTLQVLATVSALAVPFVISRIVGIVSDGRLPTQQETLWYCVALAVSAALLGAFTGLANRQATVLSERVLADIREEFMHVVLRLPLSLVERVGTGPIASRAVRDVEALTWIVRFAVPRTVLAFVTALVLMIGGFVFGGISALPLLAAPLLMIAPTMWYLKRSPRGYLREGSSYDALNATVTETSDSARTIDAVDVGTSRRRQVSDRARWTYVSERYTLALRNRYIPFIESSAMLPLALILAFAVVLWRGDVASVEQVTAAAFCALRLVDPISTLSFQADEFLMGGTSLARLVGVQDVESDRRESSDVPSGSDIHVDAVSFEYRAGHPVLRDVNLDISPGERLAIVGPSGAGKSTLGRLLAGINGPTEGSITVGGVPIVDLPMSTLHSEVALLTQEYHVFVGTIRDNLALAMPEVSDERLWSALDTVAASSWVRDMPDGLDTLVGSGGAAVDPAQAQQLALARVVLADPHTVIMDEATSLLDPRAARDMETALSTLLTGRTVISIAHRLHTAHDADRVAVVEGGRITELGSHDELLRTGGSYAALWHAWQSDN